MIGLEILSREYFGNTVQQYLLFLGIVLIFAVLSRIIDYIVRFVLKKLIGRTKTKLDDILLHSLSGPIIFFTIILGLYMGSSVLTLPEFLLLGYTAFLRILVEISLAWLFINFIDALIMHYLEPLTKKTKSDLDDHLLPFIRTVVKTGVLIIILIMILSDLGFNVTALLASLGIGGLAIGLAAKDFAANLFGGFVLIIDKPFTLGNKIKIGSDEGIVRNITLRYTELEQEDGTKKIIPNSKFVGSPIHNMSYNYKKKK